MPVNPQNQRAYLMGGMALLCVVIYLVFSPDLPSPEPTPAASSLNLTSSPSPLTTPSATVASTTVPSETSHSASSYWQAGMRVWIHGEHIRLRQTPSLTGKIIRESSAGESYYLTGALEESEDIIWAEIELNPGQTAWIGTRFLRVQEATEAVKPPPKPTLAPVVNLHLQSPARWLRADNTVRSQVALALAREILQQEQKPFEPHRAVELKNCIDASASAPDLQTLKVYELASTCAIALGWV